MNKNKCDFVFSGPGVERISEEVKKKFPSKKINIVFGCGGDRDKYKRPKMGAIANYYCSQIYLTDDNPRFENPKEIRKEIKKNILKSKVLEISNRRIAISKAIENLKSDEVLVVAGKGHEKIQDYGNKKIFLTLSNIQTLYDIYVKNIVFTIFILSILS